MQSLLSLRPDIPGYARASPLRASATSLLWRAIRVDGDRPVILKLPLATDENTHHLAVRREFSILRSIVSRNVVSAIAIEPSGLGKILVLEDIGGASLDEVLADSAQGRLGIDDALEIAACIATALDQLHLNGIVHAGVEPSNVVWNRTTGQVRLIDLSSAVLLSDSPGRSDRQVLPKLAPRYLAPERIRRPVEERDTRSDLYSLGVLLHEVLCGRPPFEGNDRAVRHAHLTLRPQRPSDLVDDIPEVLSDIALKLLEKRRPERYQSAYGVAVDLRRLQGELAAGSASRFDVGSSDVPRGLTFSTVLFGRDAEITNLRDVYREVRTGASAVRLVCGQAGIGKSELVATVQALAKESAGAVISGKFGQLEIDVPYSALASALRNLAHYLLAREQSVVEAWRDALVHELGQSLGVLVELAAEFELVLGFRPTVAALPLREGRNRFYRAISQLLRTVVGLEGAAVLLFDDLQWADIGTLELIERLVEDPDLQGVLILGTVRSDELAGNRALLDFCDRLRDRAGEAPFIRLEPLGASEVEALIRQSLGAVCGDAGALAGITTDKTGGNPFFTRQFLIQMEREGLLKFDRARRDWVADIEAIAAFHATRNVVDLMVDVLTSLPESTRRVLASAACVGEDFGLGAVAAAADRSTERCARALEPALARGLIVPVPEPAYEFGEPNLRMPGGAYRFVHDRIQQAAYAMLSEAERQETHWRIGQWMTSRLDEAHQPAIAFEAVDQLNRGYTSRRSPEARRSLAVMNHEAGLRARQSAAYRAYLRYCLRARRLATLELWRGEPDLAASLWRHQAEAAVLLGRFKLAELVIREALQRIDDPVGQAAFANLRIVRHTLQDAYADAVEVGRTMLAALGETLPDTDIDAALARELETADTVALESTLDKLADSSLQDARIQAVLRTLLNLQPPAFFTQPKLNWWIAVRIFNLTVREGYTPESAKGLANFANVLSIHSGFARGYLVSRKALQLATRPDTRHLAARIRYTYLTDQHHWYNRFEESQDLAKEVYKECVESGELQYAGYVLGIHECLNGFFFAGDLQEFDERLDKALAFAHSTLNQLAIEVITATQLVVANLRGATASVTDFDTAQTREQDFIRSCLESANRLPLGLLELLQGLCYLIHGRHEDAEACIRRAREFEGSFSCSVAYLMTRLGDFLLGAQRLGYGEAATGLPAELATSLAFFESRAADCPDNFEPIALLARAERARITGDLASALAGYDQAIASAKSKGRVLVQALASERAARFWVEVGRGHLAGHYVGEAERAFRQWGALRKAQALGAEFAGTVPHGIEPFAGPQALRAPDQPLHALDVENLLEASLDVSNQVSVGGAVDVILERLLQVSEAERAALYLVEGAPRLEATATITDRGVEVTHAGTASIHWRPPASIVSYVNRLSAEVVLTDVRDDGRFRDDPDIAAAGEVAVACLPISQQGRLIAIIYLENDQSDGVFGADRMKMLRVLGAQAAITLSRARLLDTLERRVEERTAELSTLNRELESIIDEQVRQLDQAKLFRSFLAPPVANLVRSQGGRTLLRSHRREITVLFCDIRGFTPFCDTVEPEEVSKVLSQYHEAMGGLISKHEGTLDHRAGDGMMVFFNDPITCHNSALKATRLALEMRKTMRTLLEAWKQTGYAMGFGVGIAQGHATIGLIGVDETFEAEEERWLETVAQRLVRFDYSASGREVNLASRLCDAAEDGQILVSQRVSDELRGVEEIRCEPLTEMMVKGFHSPVPVFLVEAHADAAAPVMMAHT